jgi:hypothetical protein
LCARRVEFEVTPRKIGDDWPDGVKPSNPAKLCPIEWKHRMGKEWCWSMQNCTKVMDYFCGSFKGKALRLSVTSGQTKEVDGCDLCVDYYTHKEDPIFNYGCFSKHLHSTTQPYCKTGVASAYLKKYSTFAAAHDKRWANERHELQAQMLEDGDFKDDTGKDVYTP